MNRQYKSLVDVMFDAHEEGSQKKVDAIQRAKTILSQVANQVLNLKRQATVEFASGKFGQSQKLFESALDLFPRIKELEDPASNQQAPQEKMSNRKENPIHNMIASTNIYQIFQECHMNLALCLIR